MDSPDIRDRVRLDHADVVALNFIRADAPYLFRPHFRSGLRSHILEMLPRQAVILESQGMAAGGVPFFPRARPVKMLRIFRRRFTSLAEALGETRRFKVLERCLGPAHIARSCEFYVDYRRGQRREILLCGLQDPVAGTGLDPWQVQRPGYLAELHERLRRETGDRAGMADADFQRRLRGQARELIRRVRAMMTGDALVPDLAGVRNLLVTRGPRIVLVDINNIHPLVRGPEIPLDDKGYPVLDRSLEALERLGRGLLGRSILARHPDYALFFDPVRQRRVAALEAGFTARAGAL